MEKIGRSTDMRLKKVKKVVRNIKMKNAQIKKVLKCVYSSSFVVVILLKVT